MDDIYKNFENKFITLADLKLAGLPKEIEFAGDKFVLKPEFHITLLAVGQIARIIDETKAEDLSVGIVNDFYEFTAKNPLTKYRLTGELRLAAVDSQKTIIAMAKLEGIERLFEALSEKYGAKLPVQPTHITLYTLPTDTFGIPILSYEELDDISKPIRLDQIEKLI